MTIPYASFSNFTVVRRIYTIEPTYKDNAVARTFYDADHRNIIFYVKLGNLILRSSPTAVFPSAPSTFFFQSGYDVLNIFTTCL